MNKQTQEKISKIKKCIENKEDLKEIEKKFFNTKAKKQDFLDRTYTYFDPTSSKGEITDSESVITNSKQELTESNSINTVSNQLLTTYFKDKENVEILINLIEEHKKKSYKILDNEEIEIPSEVLKLKNTGGINVKANAEQYQIIKDMAQKNNVPIATFMNYVLWYFIKSHS